MIETPKSRLERCLRQVIGDPAHDAVSDDQVAGVLASLAAEISAASLQESDPLFDAVGSDAAMPPESRPSSGRLRSVVRYEDRPEGARVGVEPLTLDGLLDLEKQLAQRGLFLALPSGPAQGQFVDVCVMMPTVGAEIWFEGRVVYQSPSGTAIDLKPLDPESAAALVRAQRAFRHAGLSAVPAPTGRPVSMPPRLRRREPSLRAEGVESRRDSGALIESLPRSPVPVPVANTGVDAALPGRATAPRFGGGGFPLQTRARVARMRTQNAFERLGVHWSASTAQVLDAYRREVSAFLPENLPPDAAAVAPEIREVVRRLQEARDALRARDGRRALRLALVGADEILRAVVVYSDRGELALDRGDLEAATDAFRRVVELAPDNHAARTRLSQLTSAH